ncbi:hypothetical protein [Methylobacterium sp. J-070]|uniref:hypothetical protein n=1 Tax=Methylobacterium sp. J-070 TaxID=2836650 RepID=UPI001FB9AA15|nr:hypothetical protein [Methylobacterium sp. J-070]
MSQSRSGGTSGTKRRGCPDPAFELPSWYLSKAREDAMAETDKPKGVSVVPPTVPIRNVNVPDPTTGSEPESKDPVEGATGHEVFEKAKAESEQRK